MKQILTPEAFKAFNYSSSFDKAVFCYTKQGMLIKDECSSWYNRVGDSLISVLDKRKETLYFNGLVVEVNQLKPTPECEVNGTKCYDG